MGGAALGCGLAAKQGWRGGGIPRLLILQLTPINYELHHSPLQPAPGLPVGHRLPSTSTAAVKPNARTLGVPSHGVLCDCLGWRAPAGEGRHPLVGAVAQRTWPLHACLVSRLIFFLQQHPGKLTVFRQCMHAQCRNIRLSRTNCLPLACFSLPNPAAFHCITPMHSSKLCYMHSAGGTAMIQTKVRPEENAGRLAAGWLAGRLHLLVGVAGQGRNMWRNCGLCASLHSSL